MTGPAARADPGQAGRAPDHAGSDAQHNDAKDIETNVPRLGIFDKRVQQHAQQLHDQ